MGKSITVARLGYPHFESINEADYSNASYIEDITNGLMVNFSFTYEWTDISTCKITNILWRPCKFKNNGTLDTDGISFKSGGGFVAEDLIIKFGDTQVGGNNQKYTLAAHVLNTSITLTQVSTKNIPVVFKYDHTNTNGRTYTLEIPNIKIPKPSRYEENVVFNKDGLNEMIDHFQKYPVIDVSSTKTNDAETTGKFGYIRITHGDSSKSADIPIRGFKASTSQNLYCDTDFLPDWHGNQTLGHSWRKVVSADRYNKLENHSADKRNYIPFREGYTYYIYDEEEGYIRASDDGVITQTYFEENYDDAHYEETPFYRRSMWYGAYISDFIGDVDNPVNYIYGKNGIFSNSIKGKYLGLPNGLTGDSININDKFKVDDQGNVTMQGNITWGTNNPIQCVYHRPISTDDLVTRPGSPNNGTTSFDNTDPDEWHKTLHSKDAWASMSYNGGQTWNTAIRINAVDGAKGDTGSWDDASIMRALKDAQAAGVRGLFTFPGDPDNSTTKLGINADAILANIASFGKIEMDPGKTYDPNNDYSLQGGFITFHIPTPFSTTNTLNSNGWVGRLGYLRGNGDGNTATAGLGLVLHTVTTWNQVYNANLAKIDGVQIGDKLHLVLASLMFTQSGLGIMLAMNTTDNGRDGTGATWLTQDRLTDNKPHYLYKYTSGSSTVWTVNDKAEKKWRLWIHEDNGRLYYSSANDGKIYLWSTE